MLKKILGIMSAIIMTVAFATGCSKSSTEVEKDKKHIVVGGTSISEVTYQAIKEKYENMGYTTEFVSFDSNPVVLEACNNGEVDISLGQHKKFVSSYNESNNGDLDMVKPYGYYTGIGLYSEKYSSVDEIPKNAKIAIMNDAMNMDIALRILEDVGLIKIDESVKNATVADIVENPKNISVIDMDQAQTVTSLKDMDAACVFFTHMSNAKKDPAKYIARDNKMIDYPMGVIVKKENSNADWSVDFAKCFREKDVQKEINDAFPGVFEFYTDDNQVKE